MVSFCRPASRGSTSRSPEKRTNLTFNISWSWSSWRAMPDKPLVTVVIPVYNYAGKVERAIRSVMAQTLNNLECFVVDDGSTDDTKAVVQGVIANDARFRYIHQDNAGVAIARNKGVFSGSAPYICCLDADDAIAPEFLEACVNVLEADPSLGVAYTGLWYIKPDGS